MDPERLRVRFHPARGVHRVAEQTVPRVAGPDNIRDHRPRVEADADLDTAHLGLVGVDEGCSCRV
eukprot:2379928-Rhodomonas_salina.1